MEAPRYHELIRPAKELIHALGKFVMDKIVPQTAVEAPQERFTQCPLPGMELYLHGHKEDVE